MSWDDVSWTTVFAYAGDALWVVGLTIMFAASRHAAKGSEGRPRLRYMGGEGPRLIVLWGVPAASFAASLYPALQARTAVEEDALIIFGLRAVSASLLALLHLRGLRDTLKP